MTMKLFALLIILCSSMASAQRIQENDEPAKYFSFSDSTFEVGSKQVCDYINFNPASTMLTYVSEIYLDSLSSMMKKHSNIRISIHYIQRNWPETAKSYSFERVTSISDYLIEKGIDILRINRSSHTYKTGMDIKDVNELFRQKNYVVEFVIIAN